MKNFKTLIAGILIGASVATSVSIMADVPNVQAFIENYRIFIDGYLVQSELPILSYNDRTYTPARMIAEAMGGTVTFDENSGTIYIKKPEPEIKEIEVPIEVIVEKIEEKIVYVEVEREYKDLPVSTTQDKIQFQIADMFKSSDRAYINARVVNNSQYYVVCNYKNSYLEVEGKRYRAYDYNREWANSIPADGGELVDALYFEPIPDSAGKVTLVIPYSIEGSSAEYKFEFKFETE